MKTAKQWVEEGGTIVSPCNGGGWMETSDRIPEHVVKAIQLDAWKQGMSDAAKVALEGAAFYAGHKSLVIACEEVARNISLNEKAKTKL